ncbi:hypothetical protein [Deinococcus sp. QL22]|uniref:hypothetical protein n=1 Tax=Deinococcus sp. QL22 TaxID=2939437 RepID=UPI00201777AD|nr:hypothetical protein [Deinococcus sp. QL22]UQN06531.1 hypothetical protein M1R55_01015 [Deinococcus sp. QL22]
MGAAIGWAVCQGESPLFKTEFELEQGYPVGFFELELIVSLSLGSAVCSARYLKFIHPPGPLMVWLIGPLVWGLLCALVSAVIAAVPTLLVGTVIAVPFSLYVLTWPVSPWLPFPPLLLAPLCAAVVRAAAGLPSSLGR